MNEINTKHVGLAAFYRYALGDHAHIATTKTPSGYTFSFGNIPDLDAQCANLRNEFFSDEGAAVGNARELLQAARQLKATMVIAERRGGTWENNGEAL